MQNCLYKPSLGILPSKHSIINVVLYQCGTRPNYYSSRCLLIRLLVSFSTLYKVSCNELDRLVELARTAPGVFWVPYDWRRIWWVYSYLSEGGVL